MTCLPWLFQIICSDKIIVSIDLNPLMNTKIHPEILIISENDDLSTDDVIGWLDYYNCSFKRVTDEKAVQLDYCHISNDSSLIQSFNTQDHSFCMSEFKSTWYRRGQLQIKSTTDHNSLFNRFRLQEDNKLTEFFDINSSGFVRVNSYKDNFINKLDVLVKAKNAGLKIPNTLIVTMRSQIEKLDRSKYIVKSISEMKNHFIYKGFKIVHGSTTRMLSDIKNIPEKFLPSLLQEYIEKRFEIRSFYIDGLFRSMAIFSQSSSKTAVDYRSYDNEKPNRCVPYQLPRIIEDKLHILMKTLNLASGSIDIICTPDNEYAFLEVNPIGQFQWVSKNCNYYLEKIIAKHLMQ